MTAAKLRTILGNAPKRIIDTGEYLYFLTGHHCARPKRTVMGRSLNRAYVGRKRRRVVSVGFRGLAKRADTGAFWFRPEIGRFPDTRKQEIRSPPASRIFRRGLRTAAPEDGTGFTAVS